MTSRKKFLLLLAPSAFCLAMAAWAGHAGASVQGAQEAVEFAPQAQAPSGSWGHAASDVPVDPSVRFGVLPNGMRYALKHNDTPSGQASLRLRIDAGSLMENADQRGLAHFMEHMVFNGTTNVPESEMLRTLERLGLAFGADANAATSFDQTFYMLELPNTRDETVDPSLMILREMMSEALMTAEAIDAERGVIVSEARTRNTPGFRSISEQLKLVAPSQLLSERLPIGDLDIIRTAPRERFVSFYNAYYRPSRATLIAVGDFDVDAMEQKIRSVFGDWRAKGPDGPEPDLGVVQAQEPDTRILVEPGVQSSMQLNWVSAPDTELDTVSKRRDNVVRQLGLAVLNRRLAELARRDDPPFVGAGASKSSLFDSLSIGSISAQFNPGEWSAALEAIEREQRRLVQFGVRPSELQREVTETRTRLEAAVAAASTRSTPILATGLLNSVNDETVFATPAVQLELFNQAVEGLTATQVNGAVARVFEGHGPLVLVVTPEDVEGGPEAVTAALERSRRAAVEAPAEQDGVDWPYTSFGPEGTVTERQAFEGVGATLVTFANGVRLTVKPTDFRDEQILVNVRTGNGELALPPDRVAPIGLAPPVFGPSGVGKLTFDELNRALSGKVYSVGFAIEEDAYKLSGVTRPEDLTTQMQVLAAYLTDPGLRPAPFERLKAVYPQLVAQLGASPSGVFERDSLELLASGDKRPGYPSAQEVAALTYEDYAAQLPRELSAGAIEITMVGDVTVDDAVAAVALTFGALPVRPAAAQPAPGADQRRFPHGSAEPVRLTHSGPADQALGYVGWPTTDARGDRTESRAVAILAAVVQLRLNDEIRERQGLAYSPTAAAKASEVFVDYGSLSVIAETPPDALPELFSAVDEIAASLRETPISEDELNRARRPIVEALHRGRDGNEYWLTQLASLASDPDTVQRIEGHVEAIEAITPAAIQALARTYLRDDKAWRATVTSASAR
ncbi:insulinase family protein [Roseibacterium beibuensis]|uniref:M16 family metallopeptidase n=1 Tax=[Roseibacterium] beibuensis TaxID=1193142 RepID=UPI00217E7391|nr:M16 family metallopeptidase [Roseibacterium beibuensis]MCS6625412.1 insulinase family protein [Roseibacterium beibuensis]